MGGVVINDREDHPLGQFVVDYLMSQRKESQYLDFKLIISISKDATNDFPKLVKDAMAFSNNGGGYILVGFQQNDRSDDSVKSKYVPVGLPPTFTIDQATLQEKINSYLNIPLEIGYLEFDYKVEVGKNEYQVRRFALIYFPPGPVLVQPTKDGDYRAGDKDKRAFKRGDILIRRGTQNVPASHYEIQWINKRIKDESYRLSIINGRVDEVDEVICCNLFKVTKLPRYVWFGKNRYNNYNDMRQVVRQKNPDVTHKILRCKYWDGRIVTFANLSDSSDEYSYLIEGDPEKEELSQWLLDEDKRRVVIELIKNELLFHAINRGMYYSHKLRKLYYPAFELSRTVEWPTRYRGVSKKIVANKIYSPKLKRFIYWHVAIRPYVETIGDTLYLNIYPTFVITEDGRVPMEGAKQGTLITSLQYNKYNDQYLNNILFWANKLSNGGENIILPRGLAISAEPVNTRLDRGIRWDIPASEIKNFIENYEVEHMSDRPEVDGIESDREEDQERLDF